MEYGDRPGPETPISAADAQNAILRGVELDDSAGAATIANMDRIDFLTLLAESRIMDIRTGEAVFHI